MLQSGFCFTTTAGRAQKASCCDFCRVRDAAVRWSGSLLPPGAAGAPPHDGERMTATTDAVVVEGITKRYNSLTAVSDLSLRIRRGAIFGLLGPNGAGKTSTLRMWSQKKILDLSKGMQQKVQFIAAILHRPPLVILDEPFAGLDPLNAAAIKDVMLELRDQGSTIILSTHRMEQVEMMCDSICLIDRGRNILNGELQAIKKSYGKNTVRIEYSGPTDGDFLNLPALVESVNRFGARVEAKLRPGADAQEILKAAVQSGVRISLFELIEPPLNDIFIEKVSNGHA